MPRQPGFWDGARLGTFQGHALVMPVGAGVMLGAGHYLLAGILAASGALGWYAWWHDYKLAWRLR